MSLWTVERLREEMMLAALRCKISKPWLLMSLVFGRSWSEADVMVPPEVLSPQAVQRYEQYKEEVAVEKERDPLRVRIMLLLLLPHPVHALQL